MRLRRRKYAVASVVMASLFLGIIVGRKVYTYIQTRDLIDKLAPGEYLFSLGDVTLDEILQQEKPAVGSVKLFSSWNASIPVGRPLSEARPQGCGLVSNEDLPETSVIIVMQDEPRFVVTRTLYSLLLRTPPDLLREIILVDDDREDEVFAKLLQRIPKITVITNENQEGLLRSFNKAAGIATSPILTFVSAKCEVNIHWLQPLLMRLHKQPRAVVSPSLDEIDPYTGEYSVKGDNVKGGFDWNLLSRWDDIEGGNPSNAIKSPIYRGQTVSLWKDRFITLGKFDAVLEINGAENLELSWKSWMCGGTVERVSCSRVGLLDYDTEVSGVAKGKENIYIKNAKRVAEVWMDDYKRFFYYTKPSARMMNVGSIQEKKSLRVHLKCRGFKWYLDQVYPQLRLPVTDEVVFGNIRQHDLCVDIEIGHVPTIAKLSHCNPDKGSQDWSFKKKGEITNGGMCLAADSVDTHGYVMVHFCTQDNSQKWRYSDGRIQREGSEQCLDSHKAEVGLVIANCDNLSDNQTWQVASKLTTDTRSKDEV